VRGGFQRAAALDLPVEVRLAIAQARTCDDAADRCFSGFFASRRTTTLRRVRTAGPPALRRARTTWRGASGAEIGALEAFHADAALHTVRAVSREVYGDGVSPPAGARCISGHRPQSGRAHEVHRRPTV
jgi:hypothetical protein